MQYEFVMSSTCTTTSLSKYITMMMCWWCWSSFVGWMHETATESTFALLRVRLNLEVLLVFDTVSYYRSLTLPCAIHTVQKHYNGDVLICLRWLNYIVLALDKQYVRLYCCGCAWTWRCYWCSINELWGRILTLLIRCLNTLPLQWRWQLTLRWPSFVEWCMELVLRWSLTNRLYVYILLKFDACCWRSMQYEVVMPPACYFAAQMHYNGNDDSALIFVCWMYGTGDIALDLNK